MEGAIESAVEREQHGARKTGSVVLIARHELGARQADARSERELLASLGVVEILAADHHADALANRARLRELGELLEFEEAVARGGVGERGDSGGGHFAAHDACARFGFRGGHQRQMIRQPRFHPDDEAGELAGRVANHVGAVRRSEVGRLEAEQRDRARVEPGRVQRLMTQAERILGHRLIEFGARRSALVEHQRLVAAERAHPVARRSLAGREAQVGEQIADRAASLNGDSGGRRGCFAKVDVRIDEAGRDRATRELDQMSVGTDQRLQFRERTVRSNLSARNRNRVAAGMAEDETLVQNQVGFPGRNCHFVTNAFVAGAVRRAAAG